MGDKHDAVTVIGPDTHIKGEMVFDSNACILGRFEGRITSKGLLEIGASAVCKASLDAHRIVVEGTVEGDIVARDRLEINAGANINGDIVATKLTVSEGATFVGHCRVGQDAAKEPAPPGAGAIPIQTGRIPSRMGNNKNVSAPAAELESTLAGFESKLAEFSRTKSLASGE